MTLSLYHLYRQRYKVNRSTLAKCVSIEDATLITAKKRLRVVLIAYICVFGVATVDGPQSSGKIKYGWFIRSEVSNVELVLLWSVIFISENFLLDSRGKMER